MRNRFTVALLGLALCARSAVGRARLELRCENTRGLVLAQPARSAHGSGGFDPLRRRQRGSYAAADRVLVATRAGGRKPAREVPAPLSPPMDRAAVIREPDGPAGAARRVRALTP